jgi:hypothetical protein
MRAIWLKAVGRPVQVVDRPNPILRASGVMVRVEAVRVPSYTREVFQGVLGYDLPTPLTRPARLASAGLSPLARTSSTSSRGGSCFATPTRPRRRSASPSRSHSSSAPRR